jgi:hypothetical protein
MKCYLLVKPDENDEYVNVYGVYKNKADAEKDMYRLDGHAFQLEYDGIEIREVEFKNTPSRFYTVSLAVGNYFHGIDGVYIYEMTEEAVMAKRDYKDQTLVFSIDAGSELGSDLNNQKKIKAYGMNIAKSIDESVLHLLDFICCDLEPRYTSNTTLSVVNTKVINDSYYSMVDERPELEYALNTALSWVEKKLNNRLDPVFVKYLGYMINDQTLFQIKEDMYAELEYFKYDFRRNPSLIPLVRDVITSKHVMP